MAVALLVVLFCGLNLPFSWGVARAADLGVRGTVWTVAEDDLLTYLQARAKAWGEAGGPERQRAVMERRARAYVNTPPPVPGISRARRTQSRLFDPSVTLTRDLKDARGQVFARAGTRFNPLDYVDMSRDLVFIDGADADQVAWAFTRKDAKIVLVAGPVSELQRQHRRRLFFDQKGLLTNQFAISRVPATVSQDGHLLRITEIALNRVSGTDTSNWPDATLHEETRP